MENLVAGQPLYLQYYQRLRQMDRWGAIDLVEQYLSGAGDVEGLYADILMPALVHAGSEWEADRISVAHEHYISEVTRDLIRRVGRRMWAHVPNHGPVALACCAPGERHVMGLMMIGDVLRAEGLTVHTLGEGAPADAVASFAAEIRADLLCVSCGLPTHLPDTGDLIALVRASRPDILVIAGGNAFVGSRLTAERMGADFFAADVREARRVLPEVMRHLKDRPAASPTG
jgi:methanogenic corrinoid protein MtbC1